MTTIEEDNNLLATWSLAASVCDACCSAPALLYCRADTAFLCGACDSTLHSHTSRHERVWICEVCEQAPAVVTCKADAASLCSSCDRDIHSANPLSRRHQRFAVVPFVDSAANAAVPGGADEDTWLIPNPSFLCIDGFNLVELGRGSQNQVEKIQRENRGFAIITDSVVPTQSNPSFQNRFENDFSDQSKKKNLHEQVISTAFNFSAQPSVSSSDIGVVPDGNASTMSEVSNTGAGDKASSAIAGAPEPVMDRKARVMRFRERRKKRRFEKTIRYASRKAYAETRPRIKGRFAKRTEMNENDSLGIDQILGFEFESGSESGLTWFSVEDGGYGVVPSF